MPLPAPVGYLYWYTTSIVLAALTLANVARRLHARWAPRERSPHDTSAPGSGSSSAGSTPSLTSFTWSRRHEQLFIELPMPDRELNWAARASRAARALWRRYITLATVPLSVGKTHIATLHLTECAWATSYIAGVVTLSLYGAGWNPQVWSNQAAWVSVAQVPLIIALAGRNNVISFLTGISYERLAFLHRWATRVCYAGIWVHTAGHLHLAAKKHDLNLHEASARWGIVGLVAMTLLIVVSLRPVRRLAHAFFTAAQAVLVVVSLVAWTLHWRAIAIWLYPGIAVWALDRAIRLGRLVALNRLWLVGRRSGSRPKAHLSSPTPSTLLVSLPAPRTPWAAGQHFYLSVPSISRLPLEAHPFTAATVPAAYDDGELQFLVRVRGGWTRRLRDKLDEARKLRGLRSLAACEIEIDARVEGAYGAAHRLEAYDAVVLVAGGGGIAHALAHLLAIVDAAKAGRGAARSVRLVWMVRAAEHVAWAAPLLAPALLDLPPTLKVAVHVHVTTPPPMLADGSAVDLDAVYWRDHRPARTHGVARTPSTVSTASFPSPDADGDTAPRPGLVRRVFSRAAWTWARPRGDSAADDCGERGEARASVSTDGTLVSSLSSKHSKASLDAPRAPAPPTAHYLPARIVGSAYAAPAAPAAPAPASARRKLPPGHPFASAATRARRPSPPWTQSTVALSVSAPLAPAAPLVTLDSWAAARHLAPATSPPSPPARPAPPAGTHALSLPLPLPLPSPAYARGRSPSLDSTSSAASFYSTATHLTPGPRPGAPRPPVPPALAPHVVWHDGRADLGGVLADAAEAMGAGCTLGVAASGPPGLLDAARRASRHAMRPVAVFRGAVDVAYVEERFEW